MRRRPLILVATVMTAILGFGAPAFADITGFLGFAGGPSTRGTKGVAVGVGLTIVGFEFEYCDTNDDAGAGSPHMRTGMFNAVLQTPSGSGGVQLYVTAGAGFYNQDLGPASETGLGTNLGGGVKKTLAGPLGVRFDYRFFRLSGSPIGTDTVNRFYVGAVLKF
jgi:hypothetical protein